MQIYYMLFSCLIAFLSMWCCTQKKFMVLYPLEVEGSALGKMELIFTDWIQTYGEAWEKLIYFFMEISLYVQEGA